MIDPPGAKLVGGCWLPESDISFENWMLRGKRKRVVDGKHTYQYNKLGETMKQQPTLRRRVCVDVGAHVGLWSMWLVREFEVVYAFEPVPLFADIFPYNVDMSSAVLHRCALGDEAGTVDVVTPDGFTGSSQVTTNIPHPGFKKHGYTGEFTVWTGRPRCTLDSFALEDVDLIKIDVEGYELNVVKGAEETIRRCQPNMVIEQLGAEIAYGHKRNSAKNLLESWGMKTILEMSGDWIMAW